MKLPSWLRIPMIALLLAVGLTASASARQYPETIPLPDGWQPEGIATGFGNQFFAGSRSNAPLLGSHGTLERSFSRASGIRPYDRLHSASRSLVGVVIADTRDVTRDVTRALSVEAFPSAGRSCAPAEA